MPKITNAVKEFLDHENWEYRQNNSEPNVILVKGRDKTSYTPLYFLINEEKNLLLFYSVITTGIIVSGVPKVKRSKLAEFLVRLNDRIAVGNFELNYVSGEVRYKTSISIGDASPELHIIKNIMYDNISRLNRYRYRIIDVITSEASPEDIIDKIKNESRKQNQTNYGGV